MERQGDHTLHLTQVDPDHPVIVGAVLGLQLPEVLRAANVLVIFPDGLVRLPDGGETAGLRSHDINADAVIAAEFFYTRAHKFQNLVLHIPFGEGRRHQGDGHVLRTYALPGLSVQVYQNHLGGGHVVCIFQQLLHQLAAALAYAHAAVSAVAGMGIGTQDHFSAACQPLPGVLVDDCLVGGNINAAVLFRGRKAESMVVLVDGAAYGAQGIVAVGHGIGNGKFLQTAGLGGLDDAHKGDIVRDEGIKFDPQLPGLPAPVMSAENGIGNGLFPRFIRIGLPLGLRGGDNLSVNQIRALSNDLYHRMFPPFGGGGSPAQPPDLTL